MRTVAIETEKRPLAQLLREENGSKVIVLTKRGRARYAVVPLDEGDEEVLAIRRNKKLMAYLDECEKRALREPRKTLAEVKKHLGLTSKKKHR